MEGLWFKECTQGRRFIIKISPGESIMPRLVEFAQGMDVRYCVVVSAVGSVKNVTLRGIKSGARLPVTEHRVNIHELEGPLELLSLEGNIIPGEGDTLDTHLHILAGKSSGEVIGGHLYHAEVFASCEVILNELHAEGIERHFSKSGGVSTIFIDEEGV